MRRKHPAAHENHERWLVSYADFITLLFAFFVVMFASTQNDKQKAKAISESVKEALEHGEFSAAISTVLGRGRYQATREELNAHRVKKSENLSPPPQAPSPRSQHPPDLAKSLGTLQERLATELSAGKVQLSLEGRGLVITMREAAFFAPGDDKVDPATLPTIGKIASVIQDLPQAIRLEGYTDSVPIHTPRFRSNWELSSARAIAMLDILRERFGMPEDRMAVIGYAENAPADTNDTPEGRAHNRRVDLVVLSEEAMKSEPQAAAPASQKH